MKEFRSQPDAHYWDAVRSLSSVLDELADRHEIPYLRTAADVVATRLYTARENGVVQAAAFCGESLWACAIELAVELELDDLERGLKNVKGKSNDQKD